ncbi:unnamed protein product [Rhizophagus irregularis]|nr:unnamed protein product [Rhizophagus irregularis]
MYNNIEIEGINWIEEAISKKHIKYEYEYFYNIKEIGSGGFGKVCRAKWKHSNKYLALKSFYNFNDAIVKEVVHELPIKKMKIANQKIICWESFTAICTPYWSTLWEISSGLRETIVPNTPVEYSNLYIECWDNDPDNRPTISQVVDKLKSMNPTINVSPIDQQAVDTFQTFSKLQSNSNSIKSKKRLLNL